MKTRIVMLVLFAMFITVVVQGCGKTDQSTRVLIAETYALAFTDKTAFFSHVKQNAPLFSPGGKWDKAVRKLGTELQKEAIKMISDTSLQESAYSIASRAGSPGMGPKVYESIKETATDMHRLGGMLLIMPSIVQEIINGSSTRYDNSLFPLGVFVVESAPSMMLPQDAAAIKKIWYELNNWMVLQYAQYI
jgi:hypothetical protein